MKHLYRQSSSWGRFTAQDKVGSGLLGFPKYRIEAYCYVFDFGPFYDYQDGVINNTQFTEDPLDCSCYECLKSFISSLREKREDLKTSLEDMDNQLCELQARLMTLNMVKES